jgi:octaprenyl-diphosphate synthase
MAGKSSSSCKYLPTEARHGGLYNYKAHWMRFCTNRLGSTELPSRIFHLSASENSTAAVLELVAPDMAQVDRVIALRLDSGVPLVAEVARYIISAGGKRLRPVLLLLTCGALGYTGAQRHNLAAVVEFIHTATLLHDDVVDESTLRRGRPTANENFGNPASVLVGDFLYSRAFQMMVDADSMRVMQTLADATNVIAEGEVLQLMNMHDASLDEEGYLRVIRSKTAKLFEASARLGAILACSPAATEDACAQYGQALGTAFQVIDDVLDYDGNAAEMGKNLGDDLREGKATLPLILAMQLGSDTQRQTVREAIETGSVERLADIVTIVRETGALEATRNAAASEAQRAIDAAMQLPDNTHRQAMVMLASQLLNRRT